MLYWIFFFCFFSSVSLYQYKQIGTIFWHFFKTIFIEWLCNWNFCANFLCNWNSFNTFLKFIRAIWLNSLAYRSNWLKNLKKPKWPKAGQLQAWPRRRSKYSENFQCSRTLNARNNYLGGNTSNMLYWIFFFCFFSSVSLYQYKQIGTIFWHFFKIIFIEWLCDWNFWANFLCN